MNKQHYYNTIGLQIEDLRTLVDVQTENCFDRAKFGALLDASTVKGLKRVIITGCGDSFSAAGAMKPAFRMHSGLKLVSVPDPMEFCRYYTKEEIREIARSAGFANADKPDSQDICFVPDGAYARFIWEHTGHTPEPGDFIDMDGCILGRHGGIECYTIGQRKGIGISGRHPYYVVAKNADRTKRIKVCYNGLVI